MLYSSYAEVEQYSLLETSVGRDRCIIFLISFRLFLLGVKEYANWPTIPQVYIDGEFIGGCDIMIQMHQSGELVEQLQKVGIKSALLEEDGTKKSS